MPVVAAAPWFVVAAVREPLGRPSFFHDAAAVFGGAHDYQIRSGALVPIELTRLADPKANAPAWAMVQGAFPDEGWLADEIVGPDDTHGTRLFRASPRGWVKHKVFDDTVLPRFLGVAFGPRGRVLTVVRDASGKPRFLALAGSAVKLPIIDASAEDRLLGVAGLPTGDLFLAGALAGGGKVFVDHWAPGAEHAQRSELPAGLGSGPPTNRTRVLLARSATDVYLAGGSDTAVGGSPYLARYDGTRWATLETPTKNELRGLDVAKDGTLFLVLDGPPSSRSPASSRRELWRRAPTASAWERVPLAPVDLGGDATVSPIDVLALGPGDTWILADLERPGGARTVALLHPVKPARPLDL